MVRRLDMSGIKAQHPAHVNPASKLREKKQDGENVGLQAVGHLLRPYAVYLALCGLCVIACADERAIKHSLQHVALRGIRQERKK
jgi:uncharacterized protein (DUF934 family)